MVRLRRPRFIFFLRAASASWSTAGGRSSTSGICSSSGSGTGAAAVSSKAVSFSPASISMSGSGVSEGGTVRENHEMGSGVG
jgi:hypothetical protein